VKSNFEWCICKLFNNL